MSNEKFKITGPGQYMTRIGEIVNLKKWNPVDIGPTEYVWQDDILRLWTDYGRYYDTGQMDPLDIIAHVDVPQPDAQDRIVGVESPVPEPVDPLARLEAWQQADKYRRYELFPGRVILEQPGVTLNILCETLADGLTRALGIVEGIK